MIFPLLTRRKSQLFHLRAAAPTPCSVARSRHVIRLPLVRPQGGGMTGAQTLNDARALVAVACTRNAAFAVTLPAKLTFIAVRTPAHGRVLVQLTPAGVPTSSQMSSSATTGLARSP